LLLLGGDQQMATAVIIIPCYNEDARLDVSAFVRLTAAPHHVSFLFVNDGSTDRTLSLLESLKSLDPKRFDLLSFPQNCGKAEAVRRGVLKAIDAQPTYVGFWDADLATPLEAIIDFVALAESRPELKLIMGSRVRLLGRRIERRAIRHYLGRFFATGVSLVLNLPVYDTQCGAKLFRVSPDLVSLFDLPFYSRWIFDVEIIARLIESKCNGVSPRPEELIYEFPLNEWRDISGSKLACVDFARAAWELTRIRSLYFRKRTGAT
jgi:glycosyltransferase involved in cell wall biosynthesis